MDKQKLLEQARQVFTELQTPWDRSHLDTNKRDHRNRRVAAVHFWVSGMGVAALGELMQCTHQNVSTKLINPSNVRNRRRSTYARDRLEAKQMLDSYPETFAALMERGSEG